MASGGFGLDPQPQGHGSIVKPLQEPIGLGFAVTAFDSNEHQEPGGDSADGDTLDLDPCVGNALKKTDHCPVTSCTCMRMASPLS